MAEVGVLQLTIEDNSESAARGLTHLATALENVKKAVQDGLSGLEGAANNIERISKVVNDAISGSTITKLGQFADALKGLKGINLKSVANAMRGFDQGAAIENTKDQVNALSTEFTKAWTAINTFYTKYAEIKGLMAGTNVPLLGSGGVAPENALSTMVWTGPNWSPDWTHGENFHPGWISDFGNVREGAIEVEGTVTDAMEGAEQAVSGAADAISDGMTVISGAMEGAAGSTGTVTDGMVEVEASVETATGSAHRFADALDYIKTKTKGAWSSLWQMRDGVNGLKGAFSAMFPTLSTFLSGMGRIAKYRLIRTVIKEITSGMSEGIQNVYHYSQAIGGSFAPSMDSAASALLQMKNSIGAALAPLIQSLIPYLQIVVNWFITAINYVNQFFALLRGQATWTRAMPATVTAFNNQTKAANKAHKAMKDLLADWDELNIIQNKSGGSGGGGGAAEVQNYASMFEEVSEYDEKIKSFVDTINNRLGGVRNIVKKIGQAILGWKVSEVFTGIIGMLGSLIAGGAIIGLVFDISTLFTKTYLDTGEPGWLIADVLATILGGVLAKKVLGNVLGGVLGKLSIPLAFGISAAATVTALVKDTDVTALSEKGILSALTAAVEGGAAAGTLFYSLGGYTAGLSAGIGGGAALFTFGTTIGIKAVADTIDAGEITSEVLAANFISAGSIGGGLALSEAVILGTKGTVGSIVGVGAGGALFTLGALLLVEAIITTLPEKIHWGSKKMTKDQIQEYVKGQVFAVDVESMISVAASAVTMTESKKNAFKAKVRALIPQIEAVKLGVDTKETLNSINDAINNPDNGIIKQFNDMQASKEEELTIAFASVRVIDGEGKDISSDVSSFFKEGWTTMSTVMTNLGKELSDAVKQSYDESLDKDSREMARNTVIKISRAMMDVEAINTANKTALSIQRQFSEGLEGVDKESILGLLTYYQAEMKKDQEFAASQFDKLLEEAQLQQMNYSDLAQKALENGGEFGGYKYEDYIKMAQNYADMYEALKEARDRSVKAALDFYKEGGTGLETIRNYMLSLLKDRSVTLDRWDNNSDEFVQAMSDIFTGGDSVLLGEKVESNITGLMKDVIAASFRESDRDAIKQALDAGVLNYSDFINKEMMNQLASRLGITGDLKEIWDQYVDDILNPELMTEKAAEQVKESVEDATSATEPIQNEMNMETTVYETVEYATAEGSETESPAVTQVKEDIAGIEGAVTDANNGATFVLNDLKFDTTGAQSSASKAAWAIEDMASRIIDAFKSLDGIGFEFSAGSADKVLEKMHAAIQVTVPAAASGGVFRSGDIFSANENGRTELIASYGNRTAVMNNDQVVGAVTNGVAQANSGVEARLTAIENRLIAMMNKEWVARAVPSSGWGQHAQQSADAYNRVTG